MPCKYVHDMAGSYRNLATWNTNLGYQIRASAKLKHMDVITIKKPTRNAENVTRVGSFMVMQADPLSKYLELQQVGKSSDAMVWAPPIPGLH